MCYCVNWCYLFQAIPAIEAVKFCYEYEFVHLDAIFLSIDGKTGFVQSVGDAFCRSTCRKYVIQYGNMEYSVFGLPGCYVLFPEI